jgi:hypothetical protein
MVAAKDSGRAGQTGQWVQKGGRAVLAGRAAIGKKSKGVATNVRWARRRWVGPEWDRIILIGMVGTPVPASMARRATTKRQFRRQTTNRRLHSRRGSRGSTSRWSADCVKPALRPLLWLATFAFACAPGGPH